MNPSRYLIDNTDRWTSLLKKLRQEGKLSEAVEIGINNLTLEELIAVKLELSTRTQKTPIFALPLWKNLDKIVKDAVLKFAISTTQTPSEGARIVGLNIRSFRQAVDHFRIKDYFKKHKPS
jgi:hypothetical protein